MEKIVDLLLNGDNVRMMLMVMIGYCWYVRLNSSFDKKIHEVEHSLNKRIDGVEKRIDGVEAAVHQLKTNDFAHLNNTIRALTFTLEKNKYLEKEDKEYVDSMLGV